MVVTLLLTVALDRALGALRSEEYDLAFPRHSVVAYSTPEFHVTARINNLGFRGGDVPAPRRTRYRIVTLGDSFTFGWGVEVEDSWPKVLEASLQKRGLDVEVDNLGQPGAYPAPYAEVAERATAVLRPDLVIVALNQADDLAQTLHDGNRDGEEPWVHALRGLLKSGLKAAYPHLISLAKTLRPGPAGEKEATEPWKGEVADLIRGLTPEEKSRFERMDGEVKGRFLRGELNPRMLLSALRRPDEMQQTLELQDAAVGAAIQEISAQLRRIKGDAERGGGRVIVVSLPNGFFVSRAMLDSYARMGFAAPEANLTTANMDEASRRAAAGAGLAFFEVTGIFRQAERDRRLFFPYDGHFNRDGHRLFAASIEPFVAGALSDAAR